MYQMFKKILLISLLIGLSNIANAVDFEEGVLNEFQEKMNKEEGIVKKVKTLNITQVQLDELIKKSFEKNNKLPDKIDLNFQNDSSAEQKINDSNKDEKGTYRHLACLSDKLACFIIHKDIKTEKVINFATSIDLNDNGEVNVTRKLLILSAILTVINPELEKKSTSQIIKMAANFIKSMDKSINADSCYRQNYKNKKIEACAGDDKLIILISANA